jgi:two-component system sensor histidine kinase RegB
MTTPDASADSVDLSRARAGAADPVALAWLVTGRWFTLAAALGAVVAGRNALESELSIEAALAIFAVILVSNLWLWWRVRRGTGASTVLAGALVCLDVVLLSWVLLKSGGVLNPAGVFYLVQIVLAALVLGRTWAWIVAALSVAGYAALFLAPTDRLHVAQVMHPEIALHMRGMWIAFALTATVIAVLVTRFASAVERRDRSIADMRDRNARTVRVASLTTVVAGAAHELGTPLSTIAVASRELERALEGSGRADGALAQDARLIRAEIDRCRAILDQMGGRIGPGGDAPRAMPCHQVIVAALAPLSETDRDRLRVAGAETLSVVWPLGAVSQALRNLLRNALQASPADSKVRIEASAIERDRVRLAVIDDGTGMTNEDLVRAGEPFFTTKPPGSGMGLGLFVARSAVEHLGGALTLARRAEGGLVAEIVLPRDVVAAGATR